MPVMGASVMRLGLVRTFDPGGDGVGVVAGDVLAVAVVVGDHAGVVVAGRDGGRGSLQRAMPVATRRSSRRRSERAIFA